MIEREVLKDINGYDPRFIGPFTLRQFFCGCISVAIAAITFLFLYYPCNLVLEICLFFTGLSMVPALLCGWIKPYGVPLEKLAMVVAKTLIISPRKRKYIIENAYADLLPQKVTKSSKELKKMKKQRLIDEKELGEEGLPIK